VRPDGDPEPDDYGLPPVDVVVPDDARELEREVLAYHREERRRRRRDRTRRLLRPVTRFGIAIPLIAGALIIALVSGALMTVFGPRPAPTPTASLLAPQPSAPPGQVGGMLPAGQVALDGAEPRPVGLRELRPGVIGIVPPSCGCERIVAELATRTREFELNLWLAADRREDPASAAKVRRELQTLAGAAHGGVPQILRDERNTLAGAYRPDPAAPGLTAVLVQPDGVVAHVLHSPQPGADLTAKVKSLG
jgi:hypothetical protein